MRDVPDYRYQLPTLSAAEHDFVRGVEATIARARYSSTDFVPIFWDTETTGLQSHVWWRPLSQRIVQIGAHTSAEFGGRELELRLNPWPVPMTYGSASATGMSTSDVFAHQLPMQVRRLCVSLMSPCQHPRICVMWMASP